MRRVLWFALLAATVGNAAEPVVTDAVEGTQHQVESVLLPGGFLLGGLVIHGGDPGIGIYLTPIGAALLLASDAGAYITAGIAIARHPETGVYNASWNRTHLVGGTASNAFGLLAIWAGTRLATIVRLA